jgi:uncharacterized protein with HEPN domain
MNRDFIDYIEDIIDAIGEIEEFIAGIDFNSFIIDKKTRNAVIRSLEVMGEAASKVPLETRAEFPEIPWKYMVGMRNKLIHEYFGIDLEIVWTVCTEEIPPLKPLIIDLLEHLKETDDE